MIAGDALRIAARSLLVALALSSSPGLAADSSGEVEPWDIKAKSSYSVRGPGGNRVFTFQDDVIILHGALIATCDRVEYLDDLRRAILSGHVVMTQDSTVVRAPVAYYDRDTRIARFPAGVVIERPTGTAIADQGWWWRNDERFELRGDAAAADTAGTINGDAMTYDVAENVFWAVGDARMVDDVSGVIVEAQSLRYEQADALATATGEPTAIFVDEDGVEIHVTADQLEYDPIRNIALAKENVTVRRSTMEATAGLVRFDRDVNRAIFRKNPVIVDGTTEIRGDRIELETPGAGHRIVNVRGRAQVANRFLSERSRPEAISDPEADGPDTVPDDVRRVLSDVRAEMKERAAELRDAVHDAPRPEELEGTPAESAREEVEAALADAAEALAAADSTSAPGGEDALPDWLRIPGDQLPRENLLFGDEITIVFENDVLRRVKVVGHGRSRFFPNEESGDLTEWNDVVGDEIDVWFTGSSLDSVVVLGHGVGEYRLSTDDAGMATDEQLKERGKLVKYEAPIIRYHRATEMMHLEGGAHVEYKTMVLTSGEIDFDAPREVMIARGDPSPVLVDVDDEIFGEEMRYDLASDRGEIIQGRTRFENAFYRGDEIWKMGNDVLVVQKAVFTTCDRETPHYHFASGKMKIYMDDKVVAKPVVLKIRNIPVFALPFYMASLKKGRHSGFLLPNLELGVDDNRGRFIRNLGYYWAPSDYADATMTFDFYPSQDRTVSYLSTRYNMRYRFNGRASVKYNRDASSNRKETAVELSHQQTLSETMSLTGDARFLSSQDFYRAIDDEQRLNRDLRSHLTFTKRFPGSNRSLRAEIQRRENLDTGAVDETLPSIVFNQPSRTITGGRRTRTDPDAKPGLLDAVYYSLDSRFVNDRSKTPTNDETNPFVREEHVGAQARSTLRTTRSFGPYLRISPSFNGEATWIDEDRLGDSNAMRATYNTSVSAGTTVYGTYLRPIGPVQGFRHVIEPSVAWSWAPEFREYFYVEEGDTTATVRDRFIGFSGIGATPRESSRMSFSLRNLLQTKIDRNGSGRRYDVFTLRNSLSYDLLAEDRGAKPLSPLSSSLNVLSSLPVNQSWTVAHDPYTWEILSTSVTTRAKLSSAMFGGAGSRSAPLPPGDLYGRPDPDRPFDQDEAVSRPSGEHGRTGVWSTDVSHTARRSTGSLTSSLVFGSHWYPTPKWELTYNTQYDLKTGENTSQRWIVRRLVHCWQLEFNRSLLGGNWQYYLRVNVIDLPDIQAERGNRVGGRSSAGTALDGLF